MKMSNYIHLIGNKYYFRARFPQHVVKTLNRKELKRSLKTDSYQEAVNKCPQVMIEYQNMVEGAERRLAALEATKPRELTEGEVSPAELRGSPSIHQ